MPRLNIRRVKGAGKSQGQGKKKKTALLQDVVDPDEGLVLLAEAPDFLGHGETLARRTSHFVRKASSAYEQAKAARKTLHSVFFIVYLSIFTLAVLLVMEGETLYEHHRSLVAALTEQELDPIDSHLPKFMADVSTIPDFWLWFRGPFINEVLPTETGGVPWDAWQGYNASRPGNFYTNLWLLAPITLRQLRVRSDSCEVSSKNVIASERTELDYMLAPAYQEKFALFSSELALDAYVSQCKTINYKPPPAGCGHNQTKAGDWSTRNPRGQVGMTPGCYAEISKDSEARDPYGPIDPKTNRSIWTWKSEKELKASKWVGRSEKIYPGSGYNITIPMDPTKARDTIEFLDMENWMDLATRAVFVDLLVYNPNVGLVSLVKLSFEFRPTQETLVFATYRHMSIHQMYWSTQAIIQMRFEVTVMIMAIMFCIKEIYVLRKLGVAYFYDGWHYLAVCNYLLHFIGFGFRLIPFVEAERLGFPPPLDTTNNYENWKFCMAINTVLTWLRAFEHLRMFPFMGYIVRVLANAVSPVLVVMLSFVVVTFSFALAYELTFAGGVHGYRSLGWTITSMARQMRGMDDFDELWEENRVLGPIYYIAWTIIGAFIFLSLFIVVLLEEAGDISSQFNMQAILKTVAGVVVMTTKAKRPGKTDIFNGQPTTAGGDLTTGLEAELSAAVTKKAQLEGKVFEYGRQEKRQNSLDKFVALITEAAKKATTDYCEITKQHFRELEETVQKVSDAADELNAKIGRKIPKTSMTRLQTNTSVRTLTGSVRSGSADVRRIVTARKTDTGVSALDVSKLRAQLR